MRIKVDFVVENVLRPGGLNLEYVVHHCGMGESLVQVNLANGATVLISTPLEAFDEALEEYDILRAGEDFIDDEPEY